MEEAEGEAGTISAQGARPDTFPTAPRLSLLREGVVDKAAAELHKARNPTATRPTREAFVMDHSSTRQAPRGATAVSPHRFALTLGLALNLAALPQAWAQSSEAPHSTEAKRPLSDAERARRDADKVSQWIRLVADRSAKATPAPTPVTPVPSKKAAAKPEATAKLAEAALPYGMARRELPEAVAAPQLLLAADDSIAEAPADAPSPPTARPDTDIQLALAAPPTTAAARPAAAPLAAPEPEVDEVLKPLLQVKPEFPASLMNTLQSGTVALQFLVTTDGRVAQVQVLNSSHKRLAPAAMAAVQQWRFEPLRREQWAKIELGFQLE